MKNIFLLLAFFIITGLNAQAPDIEWQVSLGGSTSDQAYSIQQTFDGGYIVAGTSNSNDGDVSSNQGGNDYWVVKLDDSGNIQWEKSLGGSSGEAANSIGQTSDGGYIVAGYSGSNDGDVSGNHGSIDYWVVKLDDSGNIQWEKSLGGSGFDWGASIQQTSDGGYIVAGYIGSNDGDISSSNGGYDGWVVKLDDSGNIQWEKSLGGSASDEVYSIQQTSDGGYIVAGFSHSIDGDVSGNHGGADYWVVKLDNTGNIQWEKSLGGSDGDKANSIGQTSDGGYIVAGYSSSNDGDVSGNHGSLDYWVVKLDDSGNIQWEKSLGGSDADYANSIEQTFDGGYIVAGYSGSNDGDVSGNHGLWDYWVVKLDGFGDILWEKSMGGSSSDQAHSIQQTSDGGYIVAGYSASNDGDVSGNHGNYDYWIVKLASDESYTINVTADPAEGGSVSGDGTYAFGTNITLTATPNQNYVFVNWTEDGAIVSTDTDYSFTVTEDRDLTAHFELEMSIDELEKLNVKLYPNPYTDKLVYSTEDESILKIQFYDMTGKLLSQKEGNKQSEMTILENSLPAGPYLMRVYTNKSTRTFKVIKK